MKNSFYLYERRALQICVTLAAILPFYAGLRGIIAGMPGTTDTSFGLPGVSDDIDSHYVYMSGILMTVGAWFWACVPDIEKRSRRMDVLVSLVFVGGVCRAVRVFGDGITDNAALIALAMELIVAPLILLWQRRIAHQYKTMRKKAGPRVSPD